MQSYGVLRPKQGNRAHNRRFSDWIVGNIGAKTLGEQDGQVVAYASRTLSCEAAVLSNRVRGTSHRVGSQEATHLSLWKSLQAQH